jgi:hypothetical protein
MALEFVNVHPKGEFRVEAISFVLIQDDGHVCRGAELLA